MLAWQSARRYSRHDERDIVDIEEALEADDGARVKLPSWVSLPQTTDPDPRLGELRWGDYGAGRGQWAEGFVRWRILKPVVYPDAGVVVYEHAYEGEWFDLQ